MKEHIGVTLKNVFLLKKMDALYQQTVCEP